MTDPPSDLVLDASVAIKWYVPEVHTPGALRVLASTSTFHVPSFFSAECGNTIWKKVGQRKELSPDTGAAILDALFAFPRQIHDAESLTGLAFSIALGLTNPKLTLYDFIYLALAVALDCPLVTADRPFYDAIASSRYRRFIIWVNDPLESDVLPDRAE